MILIIYTKKLKKIKGFLLYESYQMTSSILNRFI